MCLRSTVKLASTALPATQAESKPLAPTPTSCDSPLHTETYLRRRNSLRRTRNRRPSVLPENARHADLDRALSRPTLGSAARSVGHDGRSPCADARRAAGCRPRRIVRVSSRAGRHNAGASAPALRRNLGPHQRGAHVGAVVRARGDERGVPARDVSRDETPRAERARLRPRAESHAHDRGSGERPGAPRQATDDRVVDIITRTLEGPPAHATQWTTRSLADVAGLFDAAAPRAGVRARRL